MVRSNGLSFAKHVTTLSFGRPAQSVAVLACPLSPAAGLLREPHLVPVQPIRQVASSQGDAVHFGEIGMEGFSVKKRAIGRRDTLRALFEQGHADCVVQGRQVGDELSRISDAGKFLLPNVECGIVAHLRCGIIQWRSTWSGRQ